MTMKIKLCFIIRIFELNEQNIAKRLFFKIAPYHVAYLKGASKIIGAAVWLYALTPNIILCEYLLFASALQYIQKLLNCAKKKIKIKCI